MCSYKIYGFCDGHIEALCYFLRVHTLWFIKKCMFETEDWTVAVKARELRVVEVRIKVKQCKSKLGRVFYGKV